MKEGKKFGLSKQMIETYIQYREAMQASVPLNEGEKVKLDYEKIVSDVNYKNKKDRYKQFIEDNKDRIFTVVYDEKFGRNPTKKAPWLVCLQEDETNPKWLFYTNNLVKCEKDEKE